jgi:hypothetical protein
MLVPALTTISNIDITRNNDDTGEEDMEIDGLLLLLVSAVRRMVMVCHMYTIETCCE